MELLLHEPHNTLILDLLFILCTWHASAKLRLHTTTTLRYLKEAHYRTHGARNSYPSLAIYVRYIVPLWYENHSVCKIYCTLMAGKSYPSHPFVCDIWYPCSWKIIPHIIPLQLENHDILYFKSMNFNQIPPLNVSFSS